MDDNRIAVIFIDEKKGKQKESKKRHHQTARPRLPTNQIEKTTNNNKTNKGSIWPHCEFELLDDMDQDSPFSMAANPYVGTFLDFFGPKVPLDIN